MVGKDETEIVFILIFKELFTIKTHTNGSIDFSNKPNRVFNKNISL